MSKCFECGKELKFWKGYRHPVLGKKEIVCWKCFEKVDNSLEEYRKFILDCITREEQNMSEKNIHHRSKFSKFLNNLKTTH